MNKQNTNLIIRIDDRLIHGQVIVGWAKFLNLNKIIVANDAISKDKLKIQMVKLAVPPNISVDFIAINEAIESLNNNKWKGFDSILLLESPHDAYRLISSGCKINVINVGGLHVKENRKQVSQNLALNEEDKYYLRKIHQYNVFLEGRALPSDEQYDVSKVLSK